MFKLNAIEFIECKTIEIHIKERRKIKSKRTTTNDSVSRILMKYNVLVDKTHAIAQHDRCTIFNLDIGLRQNVKSKMYETESVNQTVCDREEI